MWNYVSYFVGGGGRGGPALRTASLFFTFADTCYDIHAI
jgi:hypothetical protein